MPLRNTSERVRLARESRALFEKYNREEDVEYLDRAIMAQRRAVELTMYGSTHKLVRLAIQAGNRIVRLSHLGFLLSHRYQRLARLEDLEGALAASELANDLTPKGHPHKPNVLSALGVCLSDHYRRHGRHNDLERLLSVRDLANELTPEAHPEKPFRLSALGTSLLDRYRHLAQLEDLERSLSVLERANELTPEAQGACCDRCLPWRPLQASRSARRSRAFAFRP